ncbi:hypothetical protein TcWFU_005989 [Taenia crassiceps]|uniref:C2H2-type domain-containing protein n=1 Tax=Taenia crassiceps TaxID=6207 RepID=A0ABR4Q980_9CEST
MTSVERRVPQRAVLSDAVQYSPRNASNEKVVTDEDVLPIDLTLQRKSLPSSLQTPVSASVYICPICSKKQLNLEHFVEHMTTHRWKKSLVASHERSWLLLAKSSLLKSSCRLKLLRKSRKRHRELKQLSSVATMGDNKQLIATGFAEKEGQFSFRCPACPAIQRITGIQAAVNHFENFHMQIIMVCNICGMWFSNQAMFLSHVSVVHLKRCPENVVVPSPSQPLLPSPPPPLPATTSAAPAGDFKSPQQLIDPVLASILFSGLLLSTHSTLFAGSASQNWKDSNSKVTAANGSEERPSQTIVEPKSLTKQVKMMTKAPSKVYAQQQQQQHHPQPSVPFERYPSNSATPVILYDHPLQRLLPPHVAVALDRSAVAKICHYCFKEFADEMAVLKHQVLVHRLEETTAENSA